jgi:hypothetical protein
MLDGLVMNAYNYDYNEIMMWVFTTEPKVREKGRQMIHLTF